MKKVIPIFLVLTVFTSCAALSIYGAYETDVLEFESKSWKGANPEITNKRIAMLDDLTQNHLSKGQTKEEVIELLGPSSSNYQYENGNFQNPDVVFELIYHTGRNLLEPHFFVLGFDRNNKVVHISDNLS